MKDLFGEEAIKATSTKKKIHVVSKKKSTTIEHLETKGLNDIYKNFGDWLIKKRSNKAL